ncbi:MarR family transcriptional regulator [Herbiconiux sp. CPCC 203407]|uniref:MarR family transcriptional regulator n=1 Tax=Herbiconiux oxytropis TaxID=2970915 RepID=A0AA41XKX8_9MICO|nr:MarR family transcriptional regulator [Herbiconiux oxytropis]MCS5721781.1 MarR family transcriptional regulator [Herbiconiux oxytropis]MCS5728006.1 MarR family transcriptional regulator [Herbiconiux oxytropis]
MTDDTTVTDSARRVLAAIADLRVAELKMLRRETERSGLKENDLAAMRLLREAGLAERPIGPKDLAAGLGITSASVTVLLDRLEKRGLATRSARSEDRRSLRIDATEAGLEVMASHDQPERIRALAESLDPHDAHVVERVFRDLAAAADTVAPALDEGSGERYRRA